MDLENNKIKIDNTVNRALESAGREKNSVNVIAVTKYVDTKTTQNLLDLGVKHIGENRVDQFLEKYDQLRDYEVTWHFIGSLQRRKVKQIVNFVDYFHALDSIRLAEEIQKRAEHSIKCFLQVNVSGEKTKHGFSPEELPEVLEKMLTLDKIELIGIMTMAPFDASEDDLLTLFDKTNILKEDLASQNLPHMPFTEISMGMTRDYPIAIAKGATFVRIGTAFFE